MDDDPGPFIKNNEIIIFVDNIQRHCPRPTHELLSGTVGASDVNGLAAIYAVLLFSHLTIDRDKAVFYPCLQA